MNDLFIIQNNNYKIKSSRAHLGQYHDHTKESRKQFRISSDERACWRLIMFHFPFPPLYMNGKGKWIRQEMGPIDRWNILILCWLKVWIWQCGCPWASVIWRLWRILARLSPSCKIYEVTKFVAKVDSTS